MEVKPVTIKIHQTAMDAVQHELLNRITFERVDHQQQKTLVQHAMLGIPQIQAKIPELQFVEMERELELRLAMIKILQIVTVVLHHVQSNQIMFVQEEQHQAKIHAQLVLLGILLIAERIPE